MLWRVTLGLARGGETSIALDRGGSLILVLVAPKEPGVLRAVGEVLQLITSFLLSESPLIDYNLLKAKIMPLTIISSIASGKMDFS